MGDGGLDLSRVLSKLGLNIIHVESAVDVRLVSTANWTLGSYQLIFIQFEAVALCPASNRDVVFFAAGKVIQCEWKLVIIHHAQIRVDDESTSIDHSSVNHHARFCFALA